MLPVQKMGTDSLKFGSIAGGNGHLGRKLSFGAMPARTPPGAHPVLYNFRLQWWRIKDSPEPFTVDRGLG